MGRPHDLDVTRGGRPCAAARSTVADPAAESDGLIQRFKQARTFGEAQIDLRLIFGEQCASFGSAMLKSRSSDAFTRS